jgi:hypothetical protein
MDLCRFDVNYDLRDRTRMFRALFFKKKDAAGAESKTDVKDSMKKSLNTTKPVPQIVAPFKGIRHTLHTSDSECVVTFDCDECIDRERFPLGSLSHMVQHAAAVKHNILSYFPISNVVRLLINWCLVSISTAL